MTKFSDAAIRSYMASNPAFRKNGELVLRLRSQERQASRGFRDEVESVKDTNKPMPVRELRQQVEAMEELTREVESAKINEGLRRANATLARTSAPFLDWAMRQDRNATILTRSAGAGSPSSGGDLVMPAWNADVIRQSVEYDNVTRNMELWRSASGAPAKRPIVSSATAAAAVAENTQFADSSPVTFAQQVWANECPVYPAATSVSIQLWQDAISQDVEGPVRDTNGNVYIPAPSDGKPSAEELEALVTAYLAESVGRAFAPVAISTMYAGSFTTVSLTAAQAVKIGPTATASTELASKSIDVVATAPKIVAALDPSYYDDAAWYVSPAAWDGITSQTDSNGLAQVGRNGGVTLLGFPVVVSNSLTVHDAAASTVSGVTFGSMKRAMTVRAPKDVPVLVSPETRAEYAEMYVRVIARLDAAVRDPKALVVTKYAAS